MAFLVLLPGAGRAHAGSNQPAFTRVTTHKDISKPFRGFLATFDRKAAIAHLPESAKQYRYVLVKGFFGNQSPGYMAENMKALREAGLQVEFAPVNTTASVAENSAVIENLIRTTDRPIVFIPHSKGVPDTVDAITRLHAEDPTLVRDNVRGLLSLQGAYRGTPIADLVTSRPLGRLFVRALTRVFGGNERSILDLRSQDRYDAVAAAPMPTDLIPTVSMVGYTRNGWSRYAASLAILRQRYRTRSDGMLPTRSAVIDGSDVARIRMNHLGGVRGATAGAVTLGLVDHLLRMPYER